LNLAHDAGKSVLIDPKGKDYAKYRGATLLTPNRREAADACGLEEDGQDIVDKAGAALMANHDFGAVLITQGEAGMTLFCRDREPVHLHAMARNVYDVTGAGDTVIATLAASIGAGADLESAARLANIAAGLVVEEVGTTIIKADSLKNALDGQ
jgi:D-beta-D-heptose 7-phosphate kinase/D-beta-D-heptose 1-phosphate adenosyltransferase